MWRSVTGVVCLVVITAAVGLASAAAGKAAGNAKATGNQKATGDAEKVRIGIYDNRSVAIAYVGSRFNPLRDRMAEHAAAKKAGDQDKVRELEAWGEQFQRTLHFQGFCRVPVGELLEPVKAEMTRLANEEQLAAIAPACDVTADDVELVDVTDLLVELFAPTPQTRERATTIRDAAPVPLTAIDKSKP